LVSSTFLHPGPGDRARGKRSRRAPLAVRQSQYGHLEKMVYLNRKKRGQKKGGKTEKKKVKKQQPFSSTVRIGSGWQRVAHGGSGAEVPPLAVRPEDVPVTSLT